MSRTIRELVHEAWDVQGACNLVAVVHGFARALRDLEEHIPDRMMRDTHPVAVLWADKIASLTGTQTLGHPTVMTAFSVTRDYLEHRTEAA